MASEPTASLSEQIPAPQAPTTHTHPDGQPGQHHADSTSPITESSSASEIHNTETVVSSALALSEQTMTIGEELSDVKRELQQVVVRLERLANCIRDVGLVSDSNNASLDSLRCSVMEVSGVATRSRSLGGSKAPGRHHSGRRERRSSKGYPSRKPRWKLKIIKPQGLEPVESLDSIEMKEATIKCLQADGISEAGYIEKHVLSKLIAGDDALLQLRGNMLPLYVIYPIIDLLANAIPEIYVLIVMNRLDAQSSKSFISSFNKHLEHAGLNVAVHLISHEKDFGPGSLIAVNPTTPTVFFTTVDMMARLKAENVFQSKSVFAMVVYEAEYVLRRHINVKTISPILDDFESCQLILACHDGTEDVFNGAEALSLAEDSIMISQDYINLHAAEHYYLMNSALTDKLVDRVVELSKENVAVLICHDATETNRLKIKLAERTQVYTLTKVAELNLITNGLLITPQVISTILDSKPHGKVCMIVNLSGVVTPPDRYLEMLASYMDIGEKCTVVSKVGTRDALKSIEELGVTFQEFTASTEL